MECIMECPECRRHIFFTKDGILKKKEEKKKQLKKNNMFVNDAKKKEQIIILNEKITECPSCKKKVLSQTRYCDGCGFNINKNNFKINKANEHMLMEAKTINKVLQLFEKKVKIIELKFYGTSNCEKEIPLHQIKYVQYHESTLLYIGSIKLVIEAEERGGISCDRINIISWPTKAYNYQFKLIHDAILRQRKSHYE